MQNKCHIPAARDLPPSRLSILIDGVINLLYPDSCFLCNGPVSRMSECGVCSHCWGNALRLEIRQPLCPSCGIPFQSTALEAGHLCGDCAREMPCYSGARSFGYYRAEISRMVQAFKFDGRRNLSGMLSTLLTRAFVATWDREEFDLIVPIPLHPKRRRERGFNQAALLGQGLARLTAVPFCGDALVRARHTAPQVGLSDSERHRNVRRAFLCKHPAGLSKKRILLIDDVMTTGATVCSASEALLDAGVMRVSVLTLARAVPSLA